MPEHVPPRGLVRAMAAFLIAMAGLALLFWIAALVWPGGIGGLIGSVSLGWMALFVTLHIPAAIVGILLWQWERHSLPAVRRVALEAATLYFMIAVLASIFFNYLAANVLDLMT